jgi:hypothetical protein
VTTTTRIFLAVSQHALAVIGQQDLPWPIAQHELRSDTTASSTTSDTALCIHIFICGISE